MAARKGTAHAALLMTLLTLITLTGLRSTPLVAAPASTTVSSATMQMVREDADWLLQASAPDGAIGTWIDQAHVVPYRSNFAAIGLSRATALTGDMRYAAASWRWLAWYQAHMDARGYVTDYDQTASGWRSTGDMDSTDAYASTFLLAVRETLDATGDLTWVSKLRGGIVKALAALRSTQASDGLHYAKPNWPFKYVMDDAENYAGLRAAAAVLTTLGDSAAASQASSDADRVKASFPKFYNAAQHGYDWGLHANGTPSRLNWSELYPSAVAQAWAVAFGVVTGAAAQDLFARFDAAQPWDQPTATSQYPWGIGTVDYWPVGAIAALRAGNPARAASAHDSIRNAALAKNRFWPYTTAEAGEMLMLETDGLTSPAPLISIQTTVQSVQAQGPQGVSAQLRETVTGSAIAGASLDFYSIDAASRTRKSKICSAVTSASGTAACGGTSAVIGAAPGGVEAVYAGAAIYRSATARGSIAVKAL